MRISVPDRGVFPTLTLVTATAHQLNHDNTVSVWVKNYFQRSWPLHCICCLRKYFLGTKLGLEQEKIFFAWFRQKLFHCWFVVKVSARPTHAGHQTHKNYELYTLYQTCHSTLYTMTKSKQHNIQSWGNTEVKQGVFLQKKLYMVLWQNEPRGGWIIAH